MNMEKGGRVVKGGVSGRRERTQGKVRGWGGGGVRGVLSMGVWQSRMSAD